jgi:beta-aspartyl-dipeptidase (metallo-type)
LEPVGKSSGGDLFGETIVGGGEVMAGESKTVQREPLAKLFRGGELYCPDYRGKGDVLVVGKIIAKIAPQITLSENFLEVEVVDVMGKILVPGLIDQHLHITGAGGSAGPLTRTREIKIQQITEAGVTTAVGCLGLDIITQDLKRLLVKARALEEQGITTFIYNGSYAIPPITITGSIESDLLLIDKVVGVKLGMADPLATYPQESDLKRILTAVRRGARLAGKAGVLHIHMGDCPGSWFKMMEKILQETMIPSSHVVFTHTNRSSVVFDKALEYAKQGGQVDMTAVQNPDYLPEAVVSRGLKKPGKAIEAMLAAGVSEDHLTLSSDSNAGGRRPNGEFRQSSVSFLYKEFRDLALSSNLTLALKMVTLNPAKRLGILSRKGTLDEGKEADLLVLTRDLQIQGVYAKGRQMVKDGKPVVKDPFE